MIFDYFRIKPKNYKDLKAEDFAAGLKSKDAVVIDVRSPAEFMSGKIKHARNIAIINPNFREQIINLPKDKSYYLYGQNGKGSKKACKIMGDAGFEKVYHLSGGLKQWYFETV